MHTIVKSTIAIAIGLLIIRKWSRRRKYRNTIKSFNYPFRRDLNFAWMKTQAANGNVPPMFLTDGFVKYNLGRLLILADYNLVEQCFKNPLLSMRPTNGRAALALEMAREDLNVPQLVASILGNLKLKKGTHPGIASGPYDANHRRLRKSWHQTMMKMASRNELERMVSHVGDQIIAHLRNESAAMGADAGFDPGTIFMNGSLNVITAFLCSETYQFNDPEQAEIYTITSTVLDRLMEYSMVTTWSALFPEFMIRRGWHRKLLELIKPDAFDILRYFYHEQWPLWLRKIKEHAETLDPEQPRDYLDFLIMETDDNTSDIGYLSAVMTVGAIFTAGADTLSTTMRWFVGLMAQHQQIQARLYAELIKKQKNKPSQCDYLLAVIEEVFRFRPVAESLLHVAEEDVSVDGYVIPKGTIIMANLTALHFDPVAFVEPETFNPDRFICDGRFKV